jgi:hypothetical protein
MIEPQDLSKLSTLPAEFVDSVGNELQNASIPWKAAYSDYQSGGWYVAQLRNSSGSTDQTRIDGGEPLDTPLLDQFPSLKRWINQSELDIRIVRLARIAPGAWMHEHNDNVGIGEDRLRLHIPIITNPNAVLCFAGVHARLESGFLWKLNHEKVSHAAANFGETDRTHLILDCRLNEALDKLLKQETLPPHCLKNLPLLDPRSQDALISKAKELIKEGNMADGEALLLKTFCQYDLQGQSSYELLVVAYQDSPGFEVRLKEWKERLNEVSSD